MNEIYINDDFPILLYPYEVKKLLGIGTTKFYELVKLPDFPKPRDLINNKRNVYLRSEIEAWVNNLPRTEVKEGTGGRYINKNKTDISPS